MQQDTARHDPQIQSVPTPIQGLTGSTCSSPCLIFAVIHKIHKSIMPGCKKMKHKVPLQRLTSGFTLTTTLKLRHVKTKLSKPISFLGSFHGQTCKLHYSLCLAIMLYLAIKLFCGNVWCFQAKVGQNANNFVWTALITFNMQSTGWQFLLIPFSTLFHGLQPFQNK